MEVIIFIALVVVSLILGKYSYKTSKLLEIKTGELDDAQAKLADLKQKNISLEDTIRPLKKYSHIVDVDEEINNRRLTAKKELDSLLETGEQQLTEAKEDTKAAQQQAKEYKRTALAMKNTIEGYGNDFLKPNQNALDLLAADYDHKQAGQDLAEARKHTKSMIKTDTAAECDYAESSRKETAILFVLDAFNGKIDSILSKVRHDNYGKLEQQVKDAYQLVNHNGKAFRNARINNDYLASRLNELKWAVAVNELKLQDREEQRAIREQIREEEKVRKEIEKAIKASEKEEKALQKALDITRKELEQASNDDRLKYESEIADLLSQGEVSESKNQRAISMAQQTRRGHVYIISNIGSFGEKVFKIGMTRRLEPLDRVKELGDASVPFSFDIHAMINSEDAPALEKELHTQFEHARVNKVNPRKEFFRTSLTEIKQAIETKGVNNPHWTMAAEAEEYRETKAIELGQESIEVTVL